MLSKFARHKLILFIIYVFIPLKGFSDSRFGYSFGYGGAGLKSEEKVNEETFNVSRSEGPLTIALSWEVQTSDYRSLSFEHMRGVQLSPFSSGVGFTGASWRWYLNGEIPSVAKKNEDQTYLIVSRRVYFVGLSAGVANGVIKRGGDLIETASASGIYYGLRTGYDLQETPGQVFRAELFYALTMEGSGFVKSTLSAFSVHGTWIHYF